MSFWPAFFGIDSRPLNAKNREASSQSGLEPVSLGDAGNHVFCIYFVHSGKIEHLRGSRATHLGTC
jgi:hypothetical protein